MKALSSHLEDYLKMRRGLGYKLKAAGNQLRSFVKFAEAKRCPFISVKIALQWATSTPSVRATTRAQRLSAVRVFADYMSALDPRTEIPDQRLLPYDSHRPAPCLYNDDQVRQLAAAAGSLAGLNEIAGPTYSTLFGLLAVTGMRVNEALALERKDVDLKNDVLTVREVKGNRWRLVPIHPSTRKALQDYACARDEFFPKPNCSKFFVSERGTPLNYGMVLERFSKLAIQIGLRKPMDRHGHRIHGLRHYFAIRTLLNWYRSNADAERHLPELATFLGHGYVRSVYWYLSATPELLKLAARRWERSTKGGK